MNVNEYIASGILELYVAGVLSEKENLEVHRYAEKYPEINDEIVSIETAVIALAAKTAKIQPYPFTTLKAELKGSK